MDRHRLFLLYVLRATLSSSGSGENCGHGQIDWDHLLSLADEQVIFPLVYDAIYNDDTFKSLDREVRKQARERALRYATRQIVQTNEFLTIIKHAHEHGLDPVVLKGIVCRSLYKQPYLRPSVDEDVLVMPEEAETYHAFFLEEGLTEDGTGQGSLQERIANETELSYHKENSPTYIEVHKTLFDPESEAYGSFDKFFTGMTDRTVRVQIEDVSVRTLAPSDHLLYLILHAFKHFVHSGIGIRAVCDIGMFAEHYAKEIDFTRIRNCLEEVHAFDFARAILRIIQLYLLPDAGFFECINDWAIDKIDAEPLLEDILAGGVHGNISLERLHSSNITLSAIANDKKTGQTSKQGFISTAFSSVFLPIGKMSSRYPYLKKAPVLLPAAWIQRICGYLKERRTDKKDSASESVRLGLSRVELLKKYNIIK